MKSYKFYFVKYSGLSISFHLISQIIFEFSDKEKCYSFDDFLDLYYSFENVYV